MEKENKYRYEPTTKKLFAFNQLVFVQEDGARNTKQKSINDYEDEIYWRRFGIKW